MSGHANPGGTTNSSVSAGAVDGNVNKKRRNNVGKACENCRRRCVPEPVVVTAAISVEMTPTRFLWCIQKSKMRRDKTLLWYLPGLQSERAEKWTQLREWR
jgi:hypothetical protein